MKNSFTTIALIGLSGLGYSSANRLTSSAQQNVVSGEVTSVEEFSYGKFIAKVKGDDHTNTCTSFSTFWKATGSQPTQSPLGNDFLPFQYGEISADIKPSGTAGTVSTILSIEHHDEGRETLDFATADPQDDWNIYEIQWTPDYIAYLYNGQEVRNVPINFMDLPQKIRLSLKEDGDVALTSPVYANYDYVEVWDYVPADQWGIAVGANEHHPFTFKFRDDFDSFDQSRWIASDDMSTFAASQAYVQGGNLVLKMDLEENVAPSTAGHSTDCDCNNDQTLNDIQNHIGSLTLKFMQIKSCGASSATGMCGCSNGAAVENLHGLLNSLQSQLVMIESCAASL